MSNLKLQEELPEKEKPVRISKEKVKRPCKSKAHDPPGKIVAHIKEVYSDGWTKWTMPQLQLWSGEVHKGDDFQGGNVN